MTVGRGFARAAAQRVVLPFNPDSEVGGIVLVLLLVLVLDLLAPAPRRGPDLSATVLFRPAWQRSGSFSSTSTSTSTISNFGVWV
jgi:hypothetical protein